MKLKLSKSEFLNNVSTQMLGTGIAQLLPLLVMPILTRLYSEQEFAIYTTFLAYSAVLIVAAGGRYHIAILLPKNQDDAFKVFRLSNILTFCYSVLLLIISFIVYYTLENPLNRHGLIFAIPIYVYIFGIWQSHFNFAVRRKSFNITATSKVIQSGMYAGLSGALGLVITSIGLIVGKVIGVLSSLLYIKKRIELPNEKVDLKEIKKIASKYSDYPKFSIIPAFLDTLSLQALVILIGYYYSELELGYFGLTNMCFTAPLALVGVSFRDVFYQHITALINNNKATEAKSFFVKSTLGLAIIGVLIFIVLFFLGEFLFALVFGDKWITSGKFASILAISLTVRLIVSPLSSTLNATNRVKIASLWQFTYFVTTFSVLLTAILVLKVDIYGLLKIYVIHEIILYSVYYFLQYNSFKRVII